jgi:2-(1,2-epoxy-1,2-dihydrophenyl)acetyl-CoA isomerase
METLEYPDFIRALEQDQRTLIVVDRPTPATAVVRLNDPENQNALSGALTVQLRRALERLTADPDVRVLVLTGDGPFFSVGGDWKLMADRAHTYGERAEGTTGLWKWIRYQFGGIARLVRQTDKVVIAALNGPAAGVALAWALTSDLVLASEEARLVTAFGRIGLVPEVGTNWALTRRLGYQRAFELFLRGNVLTAREAHDMGLVNAVAPGDRLMELAHEWCERVCRLPEHVVAMAKPLMRAAADMSWEHVILAEEFAEPNTFTTREHQEAVRALLAKTARATPKA